MVEAADEGQGDDAALIGWLDEAQLGRVLVESEVRARGVVVAEVAAQTPTEVPFVEDDDVIEDLAADGANKRSTKAFCQGEQAAVRTSAMPIPFTRRRNSSR